jgi:hypothetical protein
MVRCQYQYGQRARPVQWVLPTCDTDNVLELPAAGVSRLPARPTTRTTTSVRR